MSFLPTKRGILHGSSSDSHCISLIEKTQDDQISRERGGDARVNSQRPCSWKTTACWGVVTICCAGLTIASMAMGAAMGWPPVHHGHSHNPSLSPTLNPTFGPTLTRSTPTVSSLTPSQIPTFTPTINTDKPTSSPTVAPSFTPTITPTATPSLTPAGVFIKNDTVYCDNNTPCISDFIKEINCYDSEFITFSGEHIQTGSGNIVAQFNFDDQLIRSLDSYSYPVPSNLVFTNATIDVYKLPHSVNTTCYVQATCKDQHGKNVTHAGQIKFVGRSLIKTGLFSRGVNNRANSDTAPVIDVNHSVPTLGN